MKRVRTKAALGGLALIVVGAASTVGIGPAEGAFPGINGRIAFSSYDGETDSFAVASMQPDGSGTQVLANTGSDRAPRWSADGAKIVYASGEAGESEIWVMDADGSDKVQITSNDAQDFQPTWSPDGTTIAFVRQAPSSYYDIWVVDLTSGVESNVTNTNTDMVSAFAPSWSPDGSRIAYVTRATPSDDFEVYSMDPDGSDRLQLTDDVDDSSQPDWSPDGTQIVYSRGDEQAGYDLWVMDADGSNETLLYGTEAGEGGPAWSPDGTKIAFDSFTEGSSSQIVTIDADGTDPVTITSPDTDSSAPNWQPIVVVPPTTTTTAAAPTTTVAPAPPAARPVAATPRFTG